MSDDPINRYIRTTRAFGLLLRRRAAQEARFFQRTGEHQGIDAFFHEKDDELETQYRLARYQDSLRAARRAGRYVGGTTLRRVLPDGTTEPWVAPLPPAPAKPPARATAVTLYAAAVSWLQRLQQGRGRP